MDTVGSRMDACGKPGISEDELKKFFHEAEAYLAWKTQGVLGLDYPGGPAVDRLAQTGDDRAHDFPTAMLNADSLDFSFSGLKTALLYAVCGHSEVSFDRPFGAMIKS